MKHLIFCLESEGTQPGSSAPPKGRCPPWPFPHCCSETLLPWAASPAPAPTGQWTSSGLRLTIVPETMATAVEISLVLPAVAFFLIHVFKLSSIYWIKLFCIFQKLPTSKLHTGLFCCLLFLLILIPEVLFSFCFVIFFFNTIRS